MSSTSRPPLTPDESRYLDGTLPEVEARQLERQLAADPARAEALAHEREALALWREDAERMGAHAGGADSGLADRVMASIAQGAPGPRSTSLKSAAPRLPSVRAARAYATAALVLIGIGVAGTWMVRAHRAEATPASAEGEADLDAPLLDGVAYGVQNGIFRAPPAPESNGVPESGLPKSAQDDDGESPDAGQPPDEKAPR